MTQLPTLTTLDSIARDSGALAMVAMDQRESLRTMFDAAGRGRPDDTVLVDFKRTVAEILGPVASGFLIDREYGFAEIRETLDPSTGLILAADALTQDHGGPVEDTDLDPVVLSPDFDLSGVSALKLLIIWRRDDQRERRLQLARDFVRHAAERGVLSVLEPVVRATPGELDAGTWNTEDAIVEAAQELSVVGQSLYKVQVPLAGAGSAADQLRESERLGDAITGPWVVLSQGVAREHFASGVEAACRGGASGFLAGRALWSDVVGSSDVSAQLKTVSLPRLRALIDIVDRCARPWSES